jgi:hypothetical protein
VTTSANPLVTPLKRLADCKSLGAVLDTAMAFERTVLDFFGDLAPRLHEECRPMVQGFTEQTAATLAELEGLASDPDLGQHLEHCLGRPESCVAFEQYAEPPVVEETALDDDILLFALDLERVAFTHYSALFDRTPDGPVRDLFARLAKMKLSRLEALENRWSQLYTCIPL